MNEQLVTIHKNSFGDEIGKFLLPMTMIATNVLQKQEFRDSGRLSKLLIPGILVYSAVIFDLGGDYFSALAGFDQTPNWIGAVWPVLLKHLISYLAVKIEEKVHMKSNVFE